MPDRTPILSQLTAATVHAIGRSYQMAESVMPLSQLLPAQE
jgi:hypothetical protein